MQSPLKLDICRLEQLMGYRYPLVRYGLHADHHCRLEISLKFSSLGVSIPAARGSLLELQDDCVIPTIRAVLPVRTIRDITGVTQDLKQSIAPRTWALSLECSAEGMRVKIYLGRLYVMGLDEFGLWHKLRRDGHFATHLPQIAFFPHGGVLSIAGIEYTNRGWECVKLYFYFEKGIRSLPEEVIQWPEIRRFSDLLQNCNISTGGVWLMDEYRYGMKVSGALHTAVTHPVADPVRDWGFQGDRILTKLGEIMQCSQFAVYVLGVRFTQSHNLLCTYWQPRSQDISE